jgi:VanZ family protein
MKALKYWWPTIAWATVIYFLSTGAFNYDNTSRWVLPLLKWLRPDATPEWLFQWHYLIRKAAHVAEYFLLSVLVLRGLRRGALEWHWGWALEAVLICTAYALFDELHQAFVPSRSAMLQDVMLDGTGALVAQLCVALFREKSRNVTADKRR